MAQADSVRSPIRAPITGAGTDPSTNLRSADRRYFIGGSDARIIVGTTKRLCRGYGGRSAARPSRRISPATSSSSSGSQPKS
jgi:hypothetical protein